MKLNPSSLRLKASSHHSESNFMLVTECFKMKETDLVVRCEM